MTKPFKEGKGWAIRLRLRGQDIYQSGFASEAKARKALASLLYEVENADKAAGLGPHRTPLAVAFSDYALQRLPYLKGAEKDGNRINRYLRALKLPVVQLTRLEGGDSRARCYWRVELVREAERIMPNSLKAHRLQQASKTPKTDAARSALAAMMMADVTQYHLQQLIDAMCADGYAAATVDHERAELRRLFSHAEEVWRWSRTQGNPARKLNMPPIDNARDRILTNAEWCDMSEALAEYGNPYVVPLVVLMLNTAMRSCEPLTYARWCDVNWTRRVLQLPDAKGGKRDVPLNPDAMAVLTALKARDGAHTPEGKIFTTTYEAVKKAWSVARKKCGIEDVGLHDLRHTAATRYALEYNGNLPVIMLITGHKTVAMAMRYINLKADDVVRMMHQDTLKIDDAPAGYQASLMAAPMEAKAAAMEEVLPLASSNVVQGNFGRRAA
jgi:integrase